MDVYQHDTKNLLSGLMRRWESDQMRYEKNKKFFSFFWMNAGMK